MHLQNNELKYAEGLEFWQFGVINSKPDVFIASEGHLADIVNHFNREHRIYTLMKWILRVHRRDPGRKAPLMMVDAGSNHGLFSMVASVSGAHTIAFEPQTNLRSVIGLGARLNQVSSRLRVLPFAVLDKYRKLSMSNYNVNDGGIGFLDYAAKDTIMQTQTIGLDDLPAFNMLFGDEHNEKTLINKPQDINAKYAAALDACTNGKAAKMDESLVLRQPIHFLKIDVEGFELQALESAAKLFEAGLVEHSVLEFGPPHRWDVTIENPAASVEEIRKVTIAHSKKVLHRVTNEWNMDIYLLPAIGWEKTVQWMLDRGVNYNKKEGNRVVHHLKSWDFDGKPEDKDEFEIELEHKERLVTEVIPLPDELIDDYMDDLQDIGEMYLWFAKRDGNPAVLSKLEI
ncbi:hypothetical protein BJV82DRAFT_76976 [Fennellomyces sp. T-0311]|nr:hypothetical protein BJV82DRAFT_76976 [Fennellomyces sp. T-0311]